MLSKGSQNQHSIKFDLFNLRIRTFKMCTSVRGGKKGFRRDETVTIYGN